MINCISTVKQYYRSTELMTNLENDVCESLFKKYYIILETLILPLNELQRSCECLPTVYERRIIKVSAKMCIEIIFLCQHNKS